MSEPNTTEQPLQTASIELSRVQWRENGQLMERTDFLQATPVAGSETPRIRLQLLSCYGKAAEASPVEVPTPLRKRRSAWGSYP